MRQTSVSRKGEGVDVTKCGAIGDGYTDCTSAFSLAITTASVQPTNTIYLPAGKYSFNSTQTINANLKFAEGAKIKISSGFNLTLLGSIEANEYQNIFEVDGYLSIAGSSEVSVCWFGADPTGNIDSQPAFQAAILAADTGTSSLLGTLKAAIKVPSGNYIVHKPIVSNKNNTRIIGANGPSTQITGVGFAGPVIHYSNLSPCYVIPNAYAGGNIARIDGDTFFTEKILSFHRYGPAWYLNGKSQFCLEFIIQINVAQTQYSCILASRGSDPNISIGRSAFYVTLLPATSGYSNTNLGLQWLLTTGNGAVTAQTAAGCILTNGSFHNVRLDYDGSHMRIFVDGYAQTLITPGGTSIAQTGNIVQSYVEGVSFGNGLPQLYGGTQPVFACPVDGYMASLRLSWNSRGSANYSPPIAKFTEDGYTKFLINFDIIQATGALHYARTYGGTSYGMIDAWIPNDNGADVYGQIENNIVSDLTIISNNGPAINIEACPDFEVSNNFLYGQSGVLINQNSYNSLIRNNLIFGVGDGYGITNGGRGLGIASQAASNYVIVRDNNVAFFDVCYFCDGSFSLEGFNYLINARYAGAYLELAAAGTIGGSCFISDEGNSFDQPYGLVLMGCASVKVTGILFGVTEYTDSVQILINNTAGGSINGNSSVIIESVSFVSGIGQPASVKVIGTRAQDDVIFNGCNYGGNSIPLLQIDNTTLGRIVVNPEEEKSLTIALSDLDTTLNINSWIYGQLIFTGSLSAIRNIFVPSIAGYVRTITNNTNYALLVKTASGTGVYVPSGKQAVLYCDGTNIIQNLLSDPDTQMAITLNNTPTTALTYAMPDNSTLKLDAIVIGRDAVTGLKSAIYNLSSSYYRYGSTPQIIGSVTSTDTKGTNAGSPPSGWGATITTSSNNVIVQLTGDGYDQVNWIVVPKINLVTGIIPAPTVISANKSIGDYSGGTVITIQVSNSLGCTGATVCGVALSGFSIVDGTHVRGTTGAMTASATPGSITVTNPSGTGTLSNAFEAFAPTNLAHAVYWMRADLGYNAGAKTWTDQIGSKVFGTSTGYGVSGSTFPSTTTGTNGKTCLSLGSGSQIGNATPFGSGFVHEFFVAQNSTSSTQSCPRDFGDNNGGTTAGNDPFFALSGLIYDPSNTTLRPGFGSSEGATLASPFIYEVSLNSSTPERKVFLNNTSMFDDTSSAFSFASTGTPTYGRSRNAVNGAVTFYEHIYLSQTATTSERNRLYAYLDDRYGLSF